MLYIIINDTFAIIREIKENTVLESETLEAQNEELERKKRLQELKKSVLEKEREKDSQLKSLLEGKKIFCMILMMNIARLMKLEGEKRQIQLIVQS